MPDRWICPLCNHILTEDAWSRLPRTMVDTAHGSRTEITCPKCGRQTVGIAWVRVGWEPDADRIASCEAGHERIVPASKDWTEQVILVIPPDDGETFFPECRTCKRNDEGLELMIAVDGMMHCVKTCLIQFRDVGAVS